MSSAFQNAVGGSRRLNTGYYIPLVGFGTYKVTGDVLLPAIDAALTAGYRMFDTAKYYKNEEELGAAFKTLLPKHGLTRADIFITSKVHPSDGDSVARTRAYVEESLAQLQTDYIDMYLVHYPKPDNRENEDPENPTFRRLTYETLEVLKAEGKIRSVGVSNYEIRHLEEMTAYQKAVPCANQVEYHPHFARIPLKTYCDKHDIFFQAFSSLARHEPKLIEDPHVVQIAAKHNTSVPLVLLAWALNQGVGIVPKSNTPSRVIDNFSVIKIKLTEAEVAEITALDKNQNYIRTVGWLVV